MPIYEYVCRACGSELERLQKLADEPLSVCPECGESTLKRKVSAAGFRLSGSGWYETDFKSEGRHNIAGDKTKSSDSTGSKPAGSNGKSDSGTKSDNKAGQGAGAT